eukprot:5233310-Lingulodinium_polyedra.AAC.1
MGKVELRQYGPKCSSTAGIAGRLAVFGQCWSPKVSAEKRRSQLANADIFSWIELLASGIVSQGNGLGQGP